MLLTKKVIIKISVALVAIMMILSAVSPISVYAQSESGVNKFGGYLIFPLYCTCSGGINLYIYDNTYPSGLLTLYYQYGVSRLNANYNIFTPGVAVIGQFYGQKYSSSVSMCQIYVYSTCVQVPADGLITTWPFAGIGTSLLPL